MCTLGRTDDVEVALKSLSSQTYKNFECIIVDQNEQDVLSDIIHPFTFQFDLKHIRSNVKGLSVNRNIGISYATGDIIAFPDDDCMYMPDTLSTIANLFDTTGKDIITINIKGIGVEKFFIDNLDTKKLNRYNYRPFGISIGIFIKYKDKSHVELDEKLGVGAYFGADEESDLLSSLLELGYKADYYGNVYVLHPIGTEHISEDKLIRRYNTYGLGYGALLKKEIVYRKKYRLLFMFLKDTFGRLIAGLLPVKKRKYYLISAMSRLEGFIRYKK